MNGGIMKNFKTNKLVYWNALFFTKVWGWLQENHPLFMSEWTDAIEKENEYVLKCAYRPTPVNDTGAKPSYISFIDRVEETPLTFKTKSCVGWVPFQEYPRKNFNDCMFESAKHIADQGKTIDFFWSGGLDSTATLFAFNELGLHKQLRVFTDNVESPEIFDEIIKGRMDYVICDDFNIMSGLARPDENILMSCIECDHLFGLKSTFGGRGIVEEDKLEGWLNRRRYYQSVQTWRYAINFDGDWLDTNNYMPFYLHPSIEKYVCNHVIDGKMVYYDLSDDTWWTESWLKTGMPEDCEGQINYRDCKMPVRDFLYDITKDKYLSYIKPKYASGIRLRLGKIKKAGRVIAILDNGNIITQDNFNDYDWTNYIVNF